MAAGGFEGLLLLDKERGPTSHDLVSALRRILGMRRIGHCGTLDPLATGLMVMCLGRYTRLNPWLSSSDKEYLTTLQFGATSDTGDAEGHIEETACPRLPQLADIEQCLERFIGDIEQVPPAYSAIKVGGVRSHVLARSGKQIELKARPVHIERIDLLNFDYPLLQLRVRCSKGTYIRSLAEDIGRELACGAYLSALRRIASGDMVIEHALSLEQVESYVEAGNFAEKLLDTRIALQSMGQLALEWGELVRFSNGNRISCSTGIAGDELSVYDGENGDLYGVGRRIENELQPVLVLKQIEAVARRA
jgi:tRNA pseudouridine55 synthase